jgi:dTDP-4-dehydrorhamnose 3,5-epimerase
MAFRFTPLAIPDVILVEPRVFHDDRGFLVEAYKHSEFAVGGIPGPFVQDNFTSSTRHVLRGLHYQKHPKAQGKIVTVLSGRIFDVAVDIRVGSSTYGRWVSVELSDENRNMVYIPTGFAHGFCVLSAGADVLYKSTDEYSPGLDRGIIWNDRDIAIDWPIRSPILSAKDAVLPALRDADNNFRLDEKR